MQISKVPVPGETKVFHDQFVTVTAMVRGKFQRNYSQVFGSFRNFSFQNLLGCSNKTIGMASVADTADSLNQVNILNVSSRFRCFFYASVNVADSRFNFCYCFSINCYNEFFGSNNAGCCGPIMILTIFLRS